MLSKPLSRAEQLQSLVDYGRQFYERGWMWGTAGNLSVKLKHDPLEIAITPSGVSKGTMKPQDLIIYKPSDSSKPAKKNTPSQP